MRLKKYLIAMLACIMAISFSIQAFASDKCIIPDGVVVERLAEEDATGDIEEGLVCKIELENTEHKESSDVNVNSRFKINIPNWVTTSISFPSSSKFVVKTENIGVTSLTSVKYSKIKVYNTKGELAYVVNNYNAGGVSPMKSIRDSFSYPAINIGSVEITVVYTNSSGSTKSGSGTAYR